MCLCVQYQVREKESPMKNMLYEGIDKKIAEARNAALKEADDV
jgi:hypothetical protein